MKLIALIICFLIIDNQGFKSVLLYNILYILIFISILIKYNMKYACILSFILFDIFRMPLLFAYNVYKIIRIDKKLYKHLAYNVFSDMNIRISNNFEKLPKNPSILLVNYQDDIFEYFINGILPVNVCYVVGKKAKPFMKLIAEEDNIICLNKKSNYTSLSEKIIEKIKHFHIFVYIESSIKNMNGVGKIKTGIINIAKSNNIPITPICIDKISHFYGVTKKQNFYIKVGKTQNVTNMYESKIHIRHFFRDSLLEFKINKFL